MPPITIRPLQPEDLDTLHTIHTRAIREACAKDYAPDVIAVWAASRSPQNYIRAQSKGETFHVATDANNQPLGFCSWKAGEFTCLYINPDHHGQRIGTALIRTAEAAADAAGTPLTYVESTLTAQKFYERHGYTKTGTGLSTIGGKETHIPYVAMRKIPQ